jgi:cytochrome P450 family 6
LVSQKKTLKINPKSAHFSFVPKEADQKFRQIVGEVVEDREKSGTKRDDLLQVILELREKHGKKEFDDTAIAGHGMTFLVKIFKPSILVIFLTVISHFQTEGYETSSTTMSMTLYELALNPDAQKRAQLEIDQLLALNSEINENVINGLDFLECCIMETVRLHCPVFHMAKVSMKEHEFPPQYESSTKTLKMPEGTVVVIPVYGIHL